MKECPDNFPWREFLKECIPFAVVLVVYFIVQFAISAESIVWLMEEHRTVASSATDRTTPVAEAATARVEVAK